MNSKKTGAWVATYGMLISLAFIFSYLEAVIPIPIPVPGVKLGLANLAVLLVLYRYGWKEALALNLARVFLSGFLFGNLFMVIYSLAGAAGSFLVMCFLTKTRGFSIMGVSMAGGVCHNIGQVLVAYFVTKTAGIVFYLPVLLAAGLLTGLLIGLLAREVIKYIGKESVEEL